MSKLLLKEFRLWQTKNQLILEDVQLDNGSGFQKIIMKGKLQEAEALNQNERFYPMWILEREVEEFKKLIEENRSLGELDHPDNAIVNLVNVSHIVREVWWEGKQVWGRIELLNGPDPYGTPSGRILEALVRRGVTLGISSRGIGSTERNSEGYEVVQSDYQLITWDFVSNPSTHGAFLMKEGYARYSRGLKSSEQEFAKQNKVNRILDKILIK
jgi:hypothetical protein